MMQGQERRDYGGMQTSAVSILTSEHGEMRRAQRQIELRDLQAALKHGTREESCNQRGLLNYKYTYNDVVYITDRHSMKEITSCAVPGAGLDIEKAAITPSRRKAHEEAPSNHPNAPATRRGI